MEIAILGTGSVGSNLARGFASAGRDVVVGSRDPKTVERDLGDAEVVELTTQREATRRGDVVVLALPPAVAIDLADELSTDLAGKTIVDPTNEYPEPTADSSIAERIAEAAPEADVVKAFNTIGAEHFADPVVAGETATMFLAGSDDDAVRTVDELSADLGFETFLVGGLSRADRLEHLARLWIDLAGEGNRDVAFRLLRG